MMCLPWEQTRAYKMGYSDWHTDARRRIAKGERQSFCPNCSRYYWADCADEHVVVDRGVQLSS